MSNIVETRIFLLNNSPQFTVRFWKNGREYYHGAKLEFIEKGAE